MMIDSLTVVFPTFRCPEYAEIVVRSFLKHRPRNLKLTFVVVENSDDDSYAGRITSLSPDVKWVQNPLDGREGRPAQSSFPHNASHSFANAAGVIRGLAEVETDWVFIAHSDVCVTSRSFFTELLLNVELEGTVLVGTVKDNSRVRAIHVSGYLTRTDIARSISFYPLVAPKPDGSGVDIIHDVGDELDLLCRRVGHKTFCFKNTENGDPLTDDGFEAFPVDRCMDGAGKVMFMHLGRGADKMAGRYTKQGRVLRDGWVEFCKQFT